MASFLGWIGQNAEVLNVIAQYLTVLVWLTYLQLFMQQFAAARRPRMLIQRGTDKGMDSLCLVANMGEQPMYVECITVVVDAGGSTIQRRVTETRRLRDGHHAASDEADSLMVEGPLKSGTFMSLGTFRKLLEDANAWPPSDRNEPEDNDWASHLDAVEIRVVATFGSADRPIGASRRFAVEHDPMGPDNGVYVRPVRWSTTRLSGFREQAVLRRWMDQCM